MFDDRVGLIFTAVSNVLNIMKYKKSTAKAESMSCVSLSTSEADAMLGRGGGKSESLGVLRQKLFDKRVLSSRRYIQLNLPIIRTG